MPARILLSLNCTSHVEGRHSRACQDSVKPELQQQQLGERELSLPARILLGQNCTSHVEGRPSTACQDSVEPELQQQQGREDCPYLPGFCWA